MRQLSRRKNPKTLSGIETDQPQHLNQGHCRRKNPKTLSGIETPVLVIHELMNELVVGKTLKPYQGLKHWTLWINPTQSYGRKNPKTLSGIETVGIRCISGPALAVSEKP